MKRITVYEATDGSRWDSEEKAFERDALDAAVRAIEATIPEVPDVGPIAANEYDMKKAKRAVVELCREKFGESQTVFNHDADDIHPSSYAGRALSETGGPLNRIWYRFMCWHGDKLYSQPYFAREAGKQVNA